MGELAILGNNFAFSESPDNQPRLPTNKNREDFYQTHSGRICKWLPISCLKLTAKQHLNQSAETVRADCSWPIKLRSQDLADIKRNHFLRIFPRFFFFSSKNMLQNQHESGGALKPGWETWCRLLQGNKCKWRRRPFVQHGDIFFNSSPSGCRRLKILFPFLVSHVFCSEEEIILTPAIMKTTVVGTTETTTLYLLNSLWEYFRHNLLQLSKSFSNKVLNEIFAGTNFHSAAVGVFSLRISKMVLYY